MVPLLALEVKLQPSRAGNGVHTGGDVASSATSVIQALGRDNIHSEMDDWLTRRLLCPLY